MLCGCRGNDPIKMLETNSVSLGQRETGSEEETTVNETVDLTTEIAEEGTTIQDSSSDDTVTEDTTSQVTTTKETTTKDSATEKTTAKPTTTAKQEETTTQPQQITMVQFNLNF